MKIELNQKNIAELEKETISPCVTIYLPLEKTIKEKTIKSKVKLENLIKNAEKQLIAGGSEEIYAKKILSPAANLAQDHFVWKNNAAGLAIFIAPPGVLRYFELPETPKEIIYVGKGFDIARLKVIARNCQNFFILAAGKNSLAFYVADCGKIKEEKIGLPKHTQDFLPGRDPEKSIQFHGRNPAGGQSIIHGQGKGKDKEKDLLLKYFKMADKIIQKHLAKESAPLIFAGDDGIFSIYRRANSYSNLLPVNLKGNFENKNPENALKEAFEIIKNAPR